MLRKCKSNLINKVLGVVFKNNFHLTTLAKDAISPSTFSPQKPKLDLDYLCSPENTCSIRQSIINRKSPGNIDKVLKLYKDLQHCNSVLKRSTTESELINEALKIPNSPHPSIINLKNEPKVLKTIPSTRKLSFKPLKFDLLAKVLKIIKTEDITDLVGPRSYYLLDGLAELEDALIKYTCDELIKQKFKIVSVPDILPRDIIEFCGMDTKSERTQVYLLDKSHGADICLSGTAEIGVGSLLLGKEFDKSDLPLRLASVSRCFRAETSKISVEKGLYRVHQFTKVEMFGITTADKSENMLEEFVQLQELLFSSLGLELRVLDMPECELGAQANRKFDIECYLPGKKYWGEISSASNCTDYQSRRLGIKLSDGSFVHTINGTACAIPRMLIAIVETFQEKNGTISIPSALVPYMGYNTISKSKLSKLKSIRVY